MSFDEGSSIDSVGETSLSSRDHENKREIRQRELRSRRVSFVVEKPQRMSNGVVSETTRLSIIPNNSSSAQKTLLKNLEIINGGQRVNAWVDSMRASSPTHLKSLSSSVSSF
ncbi:hypothetical protein F2Q69_00045124 [Brassica cretica]|uniref:Uncharacterized protein n=1 Tax=Brassica cretica TaxID=69181 RepID=A0A8S9NF84_BRACR|nr:hypothetical protein F2Q69_00045124 [Brassica cretica]